MIHARRISGSGRGAAGAPRPATTGRREPSTSPGPLEARRELLEQLQVVEVHLQTAASLELRAERSTNATFAAVLRDRARLHRRTAESLRANLALQGLVSRRPLRRP